MAWLLLSHASIFRQGSRPAAGKATEDAWYPLTEFLSALVFKSHPQSLQLAPLEDVNLNFNQFYKLPDKELLAPENFYELAHWCLQHSRALIIADGQASWDMLIIGYNGELTEDFHREKVVPIWI